METNREELIKQREALDRQLEELDKDKVKFSVDAGIIDRLGRELVGRQETAVAELVKNAYDADAKEVTLRFINTDIAGGTLIIEDDGHGMDLDALKNGFMRLSSTDKVHNPVSPKFHRKRAGRKGIGRFATQRLGEKLVITTQTKESTTALRVVIDWSRYEIDTDINLIANDISEVPKEKPCGTTLTIEPMRERWTYAEIQRVFRYVSDLLQPSYLSDRSKNSNVVFGVQDEDSFSVVCQKQVNDEIETITDIDKSFFNKSLAVFQGYIDNNGDGFCTVDSKSLKIKPLDNLREISAGRDKKEVEKFKYIKNVHFKAYYYIYNRTEYYSHDGIGISSTELKKVNDFSRTSSGIRLYRNGFRVPPYGEIGDDWLGLDEKVNMASHSRRVPLSNRNLFGFVELIDVEGSLFEETSSREGLLKNLAFEELTDFLAKSFESCRNIVESSIGFLEKKAKREQQNSEEKTQSDVEAIEEFINTNADTDKQYANSQREKAQRALENIKQTLDRQLGETAMLRVLAGIGLSIGEFVHEIRQFSPIFQSEMAVLSKYANTDVLKNSVNGLGKNFEQFRTFAAYFDETIRKNAKRELMPIDIRDVVQDFLKIIQKTADKNQVEILTPQYDGYDLFTCPMHPSEWASILFNLYSNANKATIKARVKAKILIQAKDENNRIVFEFCDNGTGIPDSDKERIFTAFFTTSTPVGLNASQNEEMIGSGLGLKIVSDIIESYEGEIFVSNPPDGFNTCIRIELPKATEEQIKEQVNDDLFSA